MDNGPSQTHSPGYRLHRPPLVLIDLRDAGKIDTKTMMQQLLDLDYTDGYVPEVNGVATDAYERGSWDDIEYAFQQNRLTFEEYSQLFEAHRAGPDSGVHLHCHPTQRPI